MKGIKGLTAHEMKANAKRMAHRVQSKINAFAKKAKSK